MLSITFKGKDYWAADILIESGAKPSATVLYGPSDIVENTVPGDLIVVSEQDTLTFKDMQLVSPQNRIVRWDDHVESQYTLLDRRQSWWEKLHACQFNLVRCDGERLEEKTCKELFDILLAAADEVGFNTDEASEALYPTLDYKENVPLGQILHDLCEKSKHTIGFLPDGNVAVFALGSGGEQPFTNISIKNFKQDTAIIPSEFTAISAPTIFESEMTLAAKAMEEDGEMVDLADASYKPGSGWGDQWPGQYEGVADASQYLAVRSLYKLYTVSSITNDEATGDSPVNNDRFRILSDGVCVYDSSNSAVVVEKVTGEFWPETHKGDLTTVAGEHWFGKTEVVNNVFYFDRPIFKVTAGSVSEASLKAHARHVCWDEDGKLVAEKVGSGPEQLASWVTPILRHDTGNNISNVEAELTEFKRICDQEAAVPVSMEIHADLQRVEVNGKCRVARYKIGEAKATTGFAETEVYFGKNWEGLLI